MIRIFLGLSSVGLVLGLVCWMGGALDWWGLPIFWKEVIFFSFAVTTILTFNLVRVKQKQPPSFIQFYLVSIILKMLVGLAFAFFLIWKSPAETRGNVGLFLFAYIIFTGVEVYALTRKGHE